MCMIGIVYILVVVSLRVPYLCVAWLESVDTTYGIVLMASYMGSADRPKDSFLQCL